jgi:hypothetical protein
VKLFGDTTADGGTEQTLGAALLHGLEIEVLEDGLCLAPGQRRVVPL